jgi:hypothetical protein
MIASNPLGIILVRQSAADHNIGLIDHAPLAGLSVLPYVPPQEPFVVG